MSDPRIKVMAEHFAAVTGEPRAGRFEHTMATAALEAIDKAATITTVEGLDALPVGQRVVLADMLLRRMEEVVDESNWMDLGNGCPVDPETLAMVLVNVGPARVIHRGTE